MVTVNHQVGLFNECPKVGTVNPTGEVDVKGYSRVTVPFVNGLNATEIRFPGMTIDQLCCHVVVLDGKNTVISVSSVVKSVTLK